jgi:menaquinone-dependent protoporphyrinogen oxidase
MTPKTLVTYASCTGYTTGVAKSIGKAIAESGFEVHVITMKEVIDLSQYDAIIAGSAIQSASWLPEAMEFIQTNQDIIQKRPCAVFLVCMTLAMKNGEKYRPFVSDFLQPVRSIISPISEGLFAGGLDIGKVPSFWDRVKFRMSVLFRVWEEGDHRDWDAIDTWGRSLVPLLAS